MQAPAPAGVDFNLLLILHVLFPGNISFVMAGDEDFPLLRRT